MNRRRSFCVSVVETEASCSIQQQTSLPHASFLKVFVSGQNSGLSINSMVVHRSIRHIGDARRVTSHTTDGYFIVGRKSKTMFFDQEMWAILGVSAFIGIAFYVVAAVGVGLMPSHEADSPFDSLS